MNTKDLRKRLYHAMDEAARALKLKDGLRTLLRELIHRIPDQATAPISPASPGNLANILGVGDRTIRERIETLLERGLVRDARLANGRRGVERDRDGFIISISGIDLTPLLERAGEWAERVTVMKAEEQEHRRLCYDISRRRRDLKVDIASPDLPKEARALWSSLPRRVAGLRLDALRQLVDNLDQLADLVSRDRKVPSGRPEENDRQYTTNQEQSESCKPLVHAEKGDGGETSRLGSTRGLSTSKDEREALLKRKPGEEREGGAALPHNARAPLDGHNRVGSKTASDIAHKKSPPTDEQVARFLEAHPRVGNREDAARAFRQTVEDGEDPETLIAQARSYARDVERRNIQEVWGAKNWLLKGKYRTQDGSARMSAKEQAEARERFLLNTARMIKTGSNACGSIKPGTVIELLRRGWVTREDCRRASVLVPASYRDAALTDGGLQDAGH